MVSTRRIENSILKLIRNKSLYIPLIMDGMGIRSEIMRSAFQKYANSQI